jgi:uncharacterized membrane-anchored protein
MVASRGQSRAWPDDDVPDDGGRADRGIVFQFAQKRYVPPIYWTAVVLISIVGTLVTDNLVDNFGVALQSPAIAFTILLALTFAVRYGSERTLSIHSIFTTRREAFYYLAILFTFALGTAVGDLVAEVFALGYLTTGILFGVIIGAIAAAFYLLRPTQSFAFGRPNILTRPPGRLIGTALKAPGEALPKAVVPSSLASHRTKSIFSVRI